MLELHYTNMSQFHLRIWENQDVTEGKIFCNFSFGFVCVGNIQQGVNCSLEMYSKTLVSSVKVT